MKAVLSLWMLLVASSSFANNVRLDPDYVDNGIYTQGLGEDAQSDAIYSDNIDAPALLEVQYMGGANMGPCTRNTASGAYCFCNHGVFRGRKSEVKEGWYFDGRHSVRIGFHVTYNKGTHTPVCLRD